MAVIAEPSPSAKEHQGCRVCGCSSLRDDFNALRKELEERLLGVIRAQIEKLNRDSHNLSQSVLKIEKTLTKLDPEFDLNDNLQPVAEVTPVQQ